MDVQATTPLVRARALALRLARPAPSSSPPNRRPLPVPARLPGLALSRHFLLVAVGKIGAASGSLQPGRVQPGRRSRPSAAARLRAPHRGGSEEPAADRAGVVLILFIAFCFFSEIPVLLSLPGCRSRLRARVLSISAGGYLCLPQDVLRITRGNREISGSSLR